MTKPITYQQSTIIDRPAEDVRFQLPDHHETPPPPQWKMALLVLLSIYPLLLIVIPLMGEIFEDVAWLGIPITLDSEFFVRTLVTTVILVTLMSWGALPLLTRLFRRWLARETGR